MKEIVVKKKKFDWNGYLFMWSLIILPVLCTLIFYFYVNFNSIALAFSSSKGEFTLKNFEWVLNDFTAEGSVMLESLVNTFLFFINSTFLTDGANLIISYFLFKKITGTKFFRIIMYMPAIVGGVAFTTVFKSAIGPTGPVYEIMTNLFGHSYEFFADSRTAIWAILFYCFWTGLGGLLYQGAMARIPSEIFEAAILDGITPWRELINLIIPLIWPTISTLMILDFTGIFSASGPILLFTGGDYGTMTISYWIWDQVYTYNTYNTASAMGLIYTVIGVPICYGLRKLLERFQEDIEY